MSPTNTDVRPATFPAVLAPTDLADMDTRDFYSTVGEVNSAYAAALETFQQAQDNLLVMLTEQISRHVLAICPTAALVFVRVAAEYHHHGDGSPVANCEGHNARLVPYEVLDEDGNVLGGFDPLSPVMYLLERLTPLLGTEDQVLDIETREWALDCTAL